MKVVSMYKCEKCGRVYETESEAEKCENLHVKPIDVKLPWPWDVSDCGHYYKGFPYRVVVKFENNRYALYDFKWESTVNGANKQLADEWNRRRESESK